MLNSFVVVDCPVKSAQFFRRASYIALYQQVKFYLLLAVSSIMNGIIRQNVLMNCSTKSKIVKVLEIHLTLNYTKSPLLRVRKQLIINEHHHLVGHPEIKLCYAKIHEFIFVFMFAF